MNAVQPPTTAEQVAALNQGSSRYRKMYAALPPMLVTTCLFLAVIEARGLGCHPVLHSSELLFQFLMQVRDLDPTVRAVATGAVAIPWVAITWKLLHGGEHVGGVKVPEEAVYFGYPIQTRENPEHSSRPGTTDVKFLTLDPSGLHVDATWVQHENAIQNVIAFEKVQIRIGLALVETYMECLPMIPTEIIIACILPFILGPVSKESTPWEKAIVIRLREGLPVDLDAIIAARAAYVEEAL